VLNEGESEKKMKIVKVVVMKKSSVPFQRRNRDKAS
jgi:hypothetical protein